MIGAEDNARIRGIKEIREMQQETCAALSGHIKCRGSAQQQGFEYDSRCRMNFSIIRTGGQKYRRSGKGTEVPKTIGWKPKTNYSDRWSIRDIWLIPSGL
jgi:hypothetical protein